ncbi:MAG: hypothetical protein M3O41_19050 [Pseudomonadota bacterium]|nr:hypothetical protein [Pseudomonadota bacterium]
MTTKLRLRSIVRELCVGTLVSAFVSGAVSAAEVNAPSPGMAEAGATSPGIPYGPLTFSFGGFVEEAAFYRRHNETADVGSSFAGLPFPNAPNYYSPEYRQSARATLMKVLVKGPDDGVNKVSAFFETDFLSSGTTSNSNESNSYTPRLRQFYTEWQRSDLGFYVLAGQSWSLATLFTKGLSPREEAIPMTIEGSYSVGFNWARQAQLRLVKSLGDKAFLGISLESPQNIVKGAVPTGALVNNAGGNLLNSTTTYSTDVAPDVIVKFAADPGYGHYELYSLTRFLHDRAPVTAGVLATETSNTTVAESIGGGMILPVIPKFLELYVSGLVGHGNGRYGASQLGDSAVSLDGSLMALEEKQGFVRLLAHPTPTLDVYLYAGTEQSKGGNGLIPADNSACNTNYAELSLLPKAAGCGAVGKVRGFAAGFYWKVYKGRLGYLTTGPEVELVTDTTYTAANGTVGRAKDPMVFYTFRYYPFQ